jgi:hypothetical protein
MAEPLDEAAKEQPDQALVTPAHWFGPARWTLRASWAGAFHPPCGEHDVKKNGACMV